MKIDEILNDLEDKGEEIREFYANYDSYDEVYVGDLVKVTTLDIEGNVEAVDYGMIALISEYDIVVIGDNNRIHICAGPYKQIQRSGVRFKVMDDILSALPRVKELF